MTGSNHKANHDNQVQSIGLYPSIEDVIKLEKKKKRSGIKGGPKKAS